MEIVIRVFPVIYLLHVATVLGQETFPGTCAQFVVSSMPFFNKVKYMGLWYIHGIYNYPDANNAECLTSIYKLSSDGNATIIERSKKNNSPNRIDSLMIFDKPRTGEYVYVIPNNTEFSIRIQIIATDYHNFSIEWNCNDITGQSEYAIKANAVQSLSSDKSNEHDFNLDPYLDGNEVTNITFQNGTSAYLPCKVKQLGNKSVSWVRMRDEHILSVNRENFVADARFQAYMHPNQGWMLQIKFIQMDDAGLYECQVSEPKVSAKVYLHIVAPITEILGDSDRYVKAGSNVTINCAIRNALEPPSYVIWYYGVHQILPDNKRIKQIVRKPEGSQPISHQGTPQGPPQITLATLIIPSTRKTDSGNWTCVPANFGSAYITLHVMNRAESASAVTSGASIHGFYESVYGLVFASVVLYQYT